MLSELKLVVYHHPKDLHAVDSVNARDERRVGSSWPFKYYFGSFGRIEFKIA
jgi:hypothetical protein